MNFFDVAARTMRALPAETAHRMTIEALKSGIARPPRQADDPRLAVRLPRSGLQLPNPIGLAAGFDKDAEVFEQMLAFGFGFVECGTVTPRPQAGNPRPRLFRLPEDGAVINRMGFNNMGVGAFARRLVRMPRSLGIVGANVGANKDSADRIQDYVAGVKALWPYSAYITINISSPNTPGLRGLQDRGALEDLLGRIGAAAREMMKAVSNRPLFLKLAPDLDDKAVQDIAEVVLAQDWLSGLIISNTTIERPSSLISSHRQEAGGLSGAPLLMKSTRILRDFHDVIGDRLDLIGAGGVASADDVLGKLKAGAQAVQLYTALVYRGPMLVRRIKTELLERMQATGAANLSELARA